MAAVAGGSFVKGITGSGLPLVATPFMATFLGVEHAVVVIALPNLAANAWLLWEHRAEREAAADVRLLVAAGAVGAAAGTWLLASSDDRALSVILAGMITLYAVVFLAKPDLRFPQHVTRRLNPAVGLGAGVLQGAVGISGPVVATYLHGWRIPKSGYIFSVTSVYATFATVQIISMLALGLFDGERLAQSAAAFIPTVTALPLGIAVSRRISPRAFELSVLMLLLVAAGRLIWTAAAGGAHN